MSKMINRIPGSRLLISSLPGKALRTRRIARQALRCQQAFSKPCLANLISKDTHLVFYIYLMGLCLGFVLNHNLMASLLVAITYLLPQP